ncbi:MAG: alpha/beta hydrolase [Methanobrevibacter sp.]|uniref:alpha/beta fold hydrolase n=1 Tax=Methanobrevibacter sp. TaxID=66852 RepID=UPI001B6029C9|nr:alpha/beta hydrolase [Methanobrevibacter sp.]MBP3792244.1 alpha/beta hydrolase [Methanobrevibacter sp.]
MESKINVNGISIAVKEEGTGPDMVLIHGIFATKEIMNPLFNHYKQNYHVISYDVRGHGESDKPESFNLDSHADDLKAIIEYFDLKKPVVVGLSMGSYITLTAAEKYPSMMSKIVLIGVRGEGKISLMEKAIEENDGNANIDLKEMGRLISRRVYPPNTTPEQIVEYYKGNRGKTELTNEERKNIYVSLAHYDMMSDIDKVDIPVLLLVGEFDGLNPPSESEKVANALNDSQLEIIDGAGHIIFFEKKEVVISLIDSFIDK